MTNKELVLDSLRRMAKAEATVLRTKSVAGEITDTEVIDAEEYVPDFSPTTDYSNTPAGSPIKDDGQVWSLIQPHNASHYEGRPATLRALWGLKHTTNPLKAKPYVAPHGTSGMYLQGECCTDPEAADPAAVYRATQTTSYAPHDYPAAWEIVK